MRLRNGRKAEYAARWVGAAFGRVVRPSTATDLLALSMGMILGRLIGRIQFPAFGASLGLGNAGGLPVSGVIVSSVASRRRFFGNTPAAARNVLEDLGLVVFVAIGGINAGNTLLAPLTDATAVEMQSNVPWIGFPVGYAVSGILITLFGYFAMLLAQ